MFGQYGSARQKQGSVDHLQSVPKMLCLGHLMSTAQVESVLVEHKHVAEAAVVPVPHAVKVGGIT